MRLLRPRVLMALCPQLFKLLLLDPTICTLMWVKINLGNQETSPNLPHETRQVHFTKRHLVRLRERNHRNTKYTAIDLPVQVLVVSLEDVVVLTLDGVAAVEDEAAALDGEASSHPWVVGPLGHLNLWYKERIEEHNLDDMETWLIEVEEVRAA